MINETNNMKTIKDSITRELKGIEEMFGMGLITPQERFKLDFNAKESYKRIVRMTSN